MTIEADRGSAEHFTPEMLEKIVYMVKNLPDIGTIDEQVLNCMRTGRPFVDKNLPTVMRVLRFETLSDAKDKRPPRVDDAKTRRMLEIYLQTARDIVATATPAALRPNT